MKPTFNLVFTTFLAALNNHLTLAAPGRKEESRNAIAMTVISAGARHTCGRVKYDHCHGKNGPCATRGAIECFGSNSFGQANPVGGRFATVSAGRDATCGILADSSIKCWGNEESMIVTNVPQPFGFNKISVGGGHACALWKNGKAVCWGNNEYGQCSAPSGPFVNIASGYSHTCATQENGLVACWGHDGDKESSGVPDQVRFTVVTAGDGFSCGITIQRRVLCWGRSREGQMSMPGDAFFSGVSAGRRHVCAVRDASRGVDAVVCWGSNHDGQSKPPYKGEFVQVSSGAAHSCALSSNGVVRCWGSNRDGQSRGRFIAEGEGVH